MHGTIQSITNYVLGTVLVVVMSFIFLLSFTQNNQQQSASSIVETALMDASDDNAKAVSGAMVINAQKFEQDLQQSNIDSWHKHSRRNNKENAQTAIAVYYLDDKSKTANDFHKLEMPVNKNNIPIRGVKVIVLRLIAMDLTQARKKVATDQKSNNPQLGIANSKKELLSATDIANLSGDTKVYLVQPTDIITYLVDAHSDLRKDDTANGLPQTKPDNNERDTNQQGYQSGYQKTVKG